MGVKVYYYMVAAVLLFAVILPQHGRQKKIYITLMAVLHTFVCGWRYMYLTGDLRKYAWGYYTITEYGWFSEDVFQGGRNFGFFWLQKLFSTVFDGDFQIFLIFFAIVIEVILAIVIYRYAPLPWFSYFLWNCFGFYVFGFSAIKQAFAMALLMASFIGIMEEKPKKFLLWTILAGCIHVPALIFLPAYWIAKSRLNIKKILIYIASAAAVFVFRNQIVEFVSSFYYDETDYLVNTHVGGRFLMIAAMLAAGIMLRGFSGKNFSKMFNLMVVAAVLQMFSGFDNVFTRLTDYYFQFLILYLPMMFYPEKDEIIAKSRHISLTKQQRMVLISCVVLLAGMYYYKTNLGQTAISDYDNYLNYRFCWEVQS